MRLRRNRVSCPAGTAAEMAQAFQDYTGRGFYSMSSNEDYPTAAELIDYAYGRYNIHAYTIEQRYS